MTLAIYIKAPPKIYRAPRTFKIRRSKKSERFFFSFISLVGLASILFAIWPYLVWQVTTIPKLTAKIEQVPIPQSQVLSATTSLSSSVQIVEDPDGFSYFTTDYKPPASTGLGGPEKRPEEFFITIPKLKITKAHAKVDSIRFDENLAHFPGTAIPGEVGNAFVTGHSVFPQFNDPKNYRAIFTKLSDLEIGDKVYVEIEGKNLQFIVQYAKIVDPKDLSVLAPISQNGRNLTLMTCVPPGTNLKRLVVITSLI